MTTGVLMSTVQAVKAALGPIERWQTHLHRVLFIYLFGYIGRNNLYQNDMFILNKL